jgi:hypothetical protein
VKRGRLMVLGDQNLVCPEASAAERWKRSLSDFALKLTEAHLSVRPTAATYVSVLQSRNLVDQLVRSIRAGLHRRVLCAAQVDGKRGCLRADFSSGGQRRGRGGALPVGSAVVHVRTIRLCEQQLMVHPQSFPPDCVLEHSDTCTGFDP